MLYRTSQPSRCSLCVQSTHERRRSRFHLYETIGMVSAEHCSTGNRMACQHMIAATMQRQWSWRWNRRRHRLSSGALQGGAGANAGNWQEHIGLSGYLPMEDKDKFVEATAGEKRTSLWKQLLARRGVHFWSSFNFVYWK